MKKLTMLIALMAISIMVSAPLTVNAAGKKAKSEVVMKVGNKVHLFHSGKVEAQKEIALGDIITVYRESGKISSQRKSDSSRYFLWGVVG